jgi:hypothetical protein
MPAITTTKARYSPSLGAAAEDLLAQLADALDDGGGREGGGDALASPLDEAAASRQVALLGREEISDEPGGQRGEQPPGQRERDVEQRPIVEDQHPAGQRRKPGDAAPPRRRENLGRPPFPRAARQAAITVARRGERRRAVQEQGHDRPFGGLDQHTVLAGIAAAAQDEEPDQ